MIENKTKPPNQSVKDFLSGISEQRRKEGNVLVRMMQNISGMEPVMWGPSIIGFGTRHYKYESGREDDMGVIGFSPRKASLTIYIADGFHEYGDLLDKLGKHKTSVSCLYINKLSDVNLDILEKIIRKSYDHNMKIEYTKPAGWANVDDYINSLRGEQKIRTEQIRNIVKSCIRGGEEVISYQIPSIKYKGKNIVFYAAYKDHLSIYPVPIGMDSRLKPYIHGKGTLWFKMDVPLPAELIQEIINTLKLQRT